MSAHYHGNTRHHQRGRYTHSGRYESSGFRDKASEDDSIVSQASNNQLTNRGQTRYTQRNERKGYGKKDRDSLEGNSDLAQHEDNKRIRHPPHLRGKSIGMWYARQSRQKTAQELISPVMKLPRLETDAISELLKKHVNVSQSEVSVKLESGSHEQKCNPFEKKFQENLKANHNTHFASTISNLSLNDSLKSSSKIDVELKELFSQKMDNKIYKEMVDARSLLPVWKYSSDILAAVRSNQVVVLCGETGCGKTTQVAQFLLDDALQSGTGSSFYAICTQPRRIAATSVAQRVAEERHEKCGGSDSSVGYQIRLDRRLPRSRGSILYCTTGILVQYLQSDPFLQNVSHLLLDEVHERDILTDFLLAIVRDLLPKRPQLRVILMSATIDSHIFSEYFNNCPVLSIPGKLFPVDTFYLEDILCLTDHRIRSSCVKQYRGRKKSHASKTDVEYTKFISPFIEEMEANRSFPCHVLKSLRMPESEEAPEELVIDLLLHICNRERGGAILVFLPGWEKISKLHAALQAHRFFANRKYLILPLHSMMPTVNQQQIFVRPPPGVRKITLSTSIAETSLTIEDVVFVIDCGKTKMSNYDSRKKLNTLNSEWISLASSRQRQGRAGRLQPGICYRLYSRARESTFAPFTEPEMKRTPLEELILRVKILKLGQVELFLRHVPQPPDAHTVQVGLQVLRSLEAIDNSENLTPLGFHLAQLPTDPRTGKIILLGAIFGCLEPVLSIAAALSFKDPFVVPLGKEELVRNTKKRLAEGSLSDHLLLAKVLNRYRSLKRQDQSAARNYCYENFLSYATMTMLSEMVDQFCRDLHERCFLQSTSVDDPRSNVNSNNLNLVRSILCAGLFPNIGKIVNRKRTLNARKNSRKIPPRARTTEDRKVELHPRCVAYDAESFESSWICYLTKVKSTAVFLHDCSEVSPQAIIFFGGEQISKKRVGSKEIFHLGNDMEIRCEPATVQLMEELRSRWNEYLSYRVTNPGATNWETGSSDSALLQAIIKFVTVQDEEARNLSNEESHRPKLPRDCYDLVTIKHRNPTLGKNVGDDEPCSSGFMRQRNIKKEEQYEEDIEDEVEEGEVESEELNSEWDEDSENDC